MPLDRDTRRAWQRSIAHVPQAIFLADASIARNIAFGVPQAKIDMERVRRAAATAQLDEFIASLPHGYETSVGERGVRLSGGQTAAPRHRPRDLQGCPGAGARRGDQRPRP